MISCCSARLCHQFSEFANQDNRLMTAMTDGRETDPNRYELILGDLYFRNCDSPLSLSLFHMDPPPVVITV